MMFPSETISYNCIPIGVLPDLVQCCKINQIETELLTMGHSPCQVQQLITAETAAGTEEPGVVCDKTANKNAIWL